MQKLTHYFDLMLYRAYAELRDEATRAYLGIAWWVAEPLIYLGVFYVVFAEGLKGGGPGFVPLILVGMVMWKWFGSTITASAAVMGKNSGLMQQVYVPKVVLLGVTVLFNTMKFFIVLTLLLILLLTLIHVHATISWITLPLLIFIELLLVTGVSMVIAGIMPLAPDLNMVLENVMMFLMFMSGTFYDITKMHGLLHNLLMLNPIAVLIIEYRVVLLQGAWPSFESLAWITTAAVLFLIGGTTLLVKYDCVYPKLMA